LLKLYYCHGGSIKTQSKKPTNQKDLVEIIESKLICPKYIYLVVTQIILLSWWFNKNPIKKTNQPKRLSRNNWVQIDLSKMAPWLNWTWVQKTHMGGFFDQNSRSKKSWFFVVILRKPWVLILKFSFFLMFFRCEFEFGFSDFETLLVQYWHFFKFKNHSNYFKF